MPENYPINQEILANPDMTKKEFLRFSEFIQNEFGIKMPESKSCMLKARLQKRLRVLGLRTFTEYYNYVFSPEGRASELIHMIDAVTTNKTDFFREPSHFSFLLTDVLPELVRLKAHHPRRIINVWSAGCSSGEEPYTIAMVLKTYGEDKYDFDFNIIASDISTRVLEKAILGIYELERVEPIPQEYKKKYLLRNKDPNKPLVRIIPSLREKVEFRRLNLMDNDFGFSQKMDIIFCRNVIIYFDRPTQEVLLNKFYNNLNKGGYVFLGHSETLSGLAVPLVQVAPTVYRKND